MTQKLRLTLDVEYDLNGESLSDMKINLDSAVLNSVGNGLLTGHTDATVESWSANVVPVVDMPKKDQMIEHFQSAVEAGNMSIETLIQKLVSYGMMPRAEFAKEMTERLGIVHTGSDCDDYGDDVDESVEQLKENLVAELEELEKINKDLVDELEQAITQANQLGTYASAEISEYFFTIHDWVGSKLGSDAANQIVNEEEQDEVIDSMTSWVSGQFNTHRDLVLLSLWVMDIEKAKKMIAEAINGARSVQNSEDEK